MSNPSAREARLSALDGLRGLAAFIVVTHHVFLSTAILQTETTRGTLIWWVTYTPLHLLWEGTGAVMVFFVLSGFVLSLPDHTRPGYWRSYYPARLIRLYLPVAASVALCCLLVVAFPRTPFPGASPWMESHAVTPTLKSVLGDLTLVDTGWLNSVLWSLEYEVVFSVLLPLFLLASARARGLIRGAAAITLALMASTAGTVLGNLMLTYLPVFALGTVMAVNRDVLESLASRLNSLAWTALSLTAVALLTARWTPLRSAPEITTLTLTICGAALTVFLFLHWAPAVQFANTAPLQWLGLVSFSLYLVHEPLLMALTFTFPGWPLSLRMLVTVPLALLAAWAFFHTVERPSRQWARAMRRRTRDRTSAPSEVRTEELPEASRA